VFDFFQNVSDDLVTLIGIEFLLHPAQRNADNIPVMQLRTGIFVA